MKHLQISFYFEQEFDNQYNCRTTSISTSSTSKSSESKGIINSEEIAIEDFTKTYWWLENFKNLKKINLSKFQIWSFQNWFYNQN